MREQRRKAKKKKGLILQLIILVSFFFLIYSSLNIINWYLSVNKSNQIKERINKKVSTKKNKTVIDFNALKKQNPDVVGYLKVNNTKIDYVVVKASDNNFYLDHNFDKQKSLSGWVFADYRNNLDETDNNTIIFGHNMKDGSMFGELRKTLNKDWYSNKENLDIKLITEKKEYTYRVFSMYTTDIEEYYIKTDFKDEEDFTKFKEKLKSRSIHTFEIDVNNTLQILTLSTCSGNGNKRVALHAILT